MGRGSNTLPGVGTGEVFQSERTVEIMQSRIRRRIRDRHKLYNMEVNSEHCFELQEE